MNREDFAMFAEQYADLVDEAATEIEDLRSSVVAFGAPHAVRYAQDFGLGPNELHPTHYDILERCGARMDSFRRAVIAGAPAPEDKDGAG